MTPNEKAKRKGLVRQHLILEKEENRLLDEIDQTLKDLKELDIDLDIDKLLG